MARSNAKLRIVTAGEVGVDGPATEKIDTPEAVLADLFAAEAQIARAGDECRRQIEAARIAYGNAHRLMALPRVELLRTRYGPKPAAKAGGDGAASKGERA
jgi:hypothetical protein